MAFLYFENFASERQGFGRWSFDPETHARFLTPCATAQEAAARTLGWADEPAVGLLRRRRVFVTLHVSEPHVAAYVGGRLFVWPGPLVATRRTLAPGVRRFEVRDRGDVLVRLDYWHDDPPGFPGSLATDLFRLIAETTKSPFAIRRFLGRRRLTLAR